MLPETLQFKSPEEWRDYHVEHGLKIAEGVGVAQVAAVAEFEVEDRIVRGLASVPNVDADGEVVQIARFDQVSYFPKKVKACFYNHSYAGFPADFRYPIGKIISFDPVTLRSEIKITELPIGDEILTLVREGIIGHMSVGYAVTNAGPPTLQEIKQFGRHKRNVRGGILMEISLVARPANPAAKIDVKCFGAASQPPRVEHHLVDGTVWTRQER